MTRFVILSDTNKFIQMQAIIYLIMQMEVMTMDLWEVLRRLSEASPLEFLTLILNPIYGPMFLWALLGLIVAEIQKFLGIH